MNKSIANVAQHYIIIKLSKGLKPLESCTRIVVKAN
jgi:hypothetical protein